MHRTLRKTAGTLTAALAGGLLVTACGDGSTQKDFRSYVPAETILYSGYTDADLARQNADINAAYMRDLAQGAGTRVDPEAVASDAGPAAGLLAGIYERAMDRLAEDGSWLGGLGIQREGPRGLYTAGALPVLRLALADSERFWGEIDEAEALAGVDHETGSRDETVLRRYPLQLGAGSGERELDLVVATRGGYAVVTLAGSGIGDQALALALGEDRPEESLAGTDKLERLADEHGTLSGATGFIDHKRLAAGLTDDSANRFGSMLTALVEAWNGNTAVLDTVRSPACRDDVRAIADQWPRTAVGLSDIDADSGDISTHMALVTNDDKTAKSLQGLRGHIPEPIEGRPMIGLGIGLNPGELASTAEDLLARFAEADMECPPLTALQQQARQADVRNLRMATRMIGDVKGIGIAVRDISSTGSGPMQMKLDAVAEMATAEPAALWRFIQSSAGLPSQPSPQPGGEPTGVQLPPIVPFDLNVAIRDNALIAVTGDAGLDEAAGEADLNANGVMNARFDYGRALASMTKIAPEAARQRAEMPKPEAIRQVDAYYDLALDVAPEAIELDLHMNVSTDD